MSYKETGTCCFCGKKYTHWGNSISPLIHPSSIDARCCDVCNATIVVPNRMVLWGKSLFVIQDKNSKQFFTDYNTHDDMVVFSLDVLNAHMYHTENDAIQSMETIKKIIKEDFVFTWLEYLSKISDACKTGNTLDLVVKKYCIWEDK